MTEARAGVVLGPGEGDRVRTAGTGGPALGTTVVKATASDTAGAYAAREHLVPAGQGMAHLHAHHAMEEAFVVLEGELAFQLEGRQVTLGAGGFVLVPRGTRHTFGNPSARPARCLVLFSPPGFERFFEELAALRATSPDGRVDAVTLVELAKRYQTEYFDLPPRV